MSTAIGMYRGTVAASAFLLDVELLGENEARRRILSLWTAGCRLLQLDHGWLLVLPRPVEIRAERAPGLALRADNGGLASAGLAAEAGTVAFARGGSVERIPLAELTSVAIAGWVDVASVQVHRLTPCDSVAEAAVTPVTVRPPEPDLRSAAGIGDALSARRLFTLRGNGGFAGRSGHIRWPVLAVTIAVVVLVTALVLLATRHASPGSARPQVVVPTAPTSPPSTGISPLAPVGAGLAMWLIFAITRGAQPGRNRTSVSSTRSRGWNWFTRVVFRTPVRGFVSRRHERYLRRLTQQFERRQWDDALREAIALGGAGGAAMHLRLPKRRESLAPGTSRAGNGSLYYGDTVYQHLQELYRRAAEQLEHAGRISEAAFAHADLLHDSAAAVALLERHDHLRLAAELAEARKLSPDLIVRLWWRAGDRHRAIEVARTKGAFAAAIARLTGVDPEEARHLRAEWVRACQTAGDHLGAVEAAWPEATLRPTVMSNVRSGIDLGGTAAARLAAYLVSEEPTGENVRQAIELLESTDDGSRMSRQRFITTLAGLRASDKAQDRRLCSVSLRALIRDGAGGAMDAKSTRRMIQTLRQRADPLLVADLAPIPLRKALAGEKLQVTLDSERGQLAVFDAVALADDLLLLAHGDFGARLVSPDGRVRARWDLPTHQLVVADHGGSVLLISKAGADRQINRLDLVSRQVRAWSTLRLKHVLPSFDGSILVVVDDDGIALLDALADPPRILWRELDRDARILRIARTPTSLTALVNFAPAMASGKRLTQLWSWQLPNMILRLRRNLDLSSNIQDAVVTSGQLVTLEDRSSSGASILRYEGYKDAVVVAANLAKDSTIHSSSSTYAIINPDADGGADLAVTTGMQHVVQAKVFDREGIGIREHDERLSIWNRAGCLAAVHITTSNLSANLRTLL